MWHRRIENWLKLNNDTRFTIGLRTDRWIKSFERDIEHWGFPVFIEYHPKIGKGKIYYWLERTDRKIYHWMKRTDERSQGRSSNVE